MEVYISSYARSQIVRNLQQYFDDIRDSHPYGFYIYFTDYSSVRVTHPPAIFIQDVSDSKGVGTEVKLYLDFSNNELTTEKVISKIVIDYGDIELRNVNMRVPQGKIGIIVVSLRFML